MPGGILQTGDLTDLEPRIFIEELLGFARNAYNLRNLCRIVQCPKLQARVRTATRGTIHAKVEELEEPDIKAADYTYVDLSLYKNAGHVVVSDEAQMRASFDVFNLEIQDAGRDLARLENTQIAAEWNGTNSGSAGGTTVTGSDWGGAADPARDVLELAAAAMEVLDLGYEPQDLAMHPLVYADLVTNTNVAKELTHTDLIRQGGVMSIYGFNITRDIHLTNTRCYVVDKNAPSCLLAQGGTSAARYRSEPRGMDAYIVRQWLQPYVVRTNSLYILTGVHV